MARVILYFEKGDVGEPDVVMSWTQRKHRRTRRHWNMHRRWMRHLSRAERLAGDGSVIVDCGRDADGAPWETERPINEAWPQWNDMDVPYALETPAYRWVLLQSPRRGARIAKQIRREVERLDREYSEELF